MCCDESKACLNDFDNLTTEKCKGSGSENLCNTNIWKFSNETVYIFRYGDGDRKEFNIFSPFGPYYDVVKIDRTEECIFSFPKFENNTTIAGVFRECSETFTDL